MPANTRFLQLFISLKVFKSKEMFFDSNKCKLFYKVIYFFPHCLCIDDKLENSPVFQADQQFEMVLFVHIFM